MKPQFRWANNLLSFLSGHLAKTMAALTALLFCALFSTGANASCGHRVNPRFALASPEVRSLESSGAMQESSEAATEDEDGNTIVGFWDVRFLLRTGELFDEGFDQFHSDGLEILNDNGAPQPANGAGTVCLGVFKKTGQGTYKVRHPFWTVDENGNLSGNGVFLETIILKSHTTFLGSFTAITYDLNGHETSRVEGNLEAQRITVE